MALLVLAAVGASAAPALAAAPDTIIDSGPPAATNVSSATFSFHANPAGSGSTTFECKRDGFAYAACSSPKTYSGPGEGQHTFSVRASDSGGTDASPATATWTIDLTAPTTTVTQQPPALTNSRTVTFAFSSDDHTATFVCSLNGAPAAPCSSPLQYAGETDATRTLLIQAVDAAGNADASAHPITWTVDATPPTTSITNHPPDLDNHANTDFSLASPDTSATFECSLDGASFVPCGATPSVGPLTGDGPHDFAARAVDPAGNRDPSPATFHWTADLVPPDPPSQLILFQNLGTQPAARSGGPGQVPAAPTPDTTTPPATPRLPAAMGGQLAAAQITPLAATPPQTPAFVLATKLRAQWTARGPDVQHFGVSVLSNYANANANHIGWAPVAIRHFEITGNAVGINVAPGRLVCIAVTAVDAAGNRSGPVQACTTVPFGLFNFPNAQDLAFVAPVPAPLTNSPLPGSQIGATHHKYPRYANPKMRVVRDAHSWQGRYITGPAQSVVQLWGGKTLGGCYVGCLTPLDCHWNPCDYRFPTAIAYLDTPTTVAIIATTCPACGTLRMGYAFADHKVTRLFAHPTWWRHVTGPGTTLDFRSPTLRRGRLFVLTVPESVHAIVLFFEVLSGNPRIEGIAAPPREDAVPPVDELSSALSLSTGEFFNPYGQ